MNQQLQLYTEAEQRAIMDVVRYALSVTTNDVLVWVSISPHCRMVGVYGYLDGWQPAKSKPYDFNIDIYLGDEEAESLSQLAILSCDLREAVGVKS
jgi:hypothetical protein